MGPGELRHRLIIKYNAKAGETDENGNPIYDWQPLCTIWAKRHGLKGRTFYEAAAIQAESDVIFTIRYRGDIRAGMQIIEGDQVFEIYTPPVDSEGKRKWIELHARAVLISGS